MRAALSAALLSLGALSAEGLADDLFKAPDCPAYKPKTPCPSKTHVLAQKSGGAKKKNWPFTYGGCEPSAFSMFSMMGADDLKGGLDGLNSKKGNNKNKLDTCCRERDFSQQICGMTKKKVEDKYSSCGKKKCKGDKNCEMQSSFGIMMSGGLGGDKGDKCGDYNKFQEDNCECVKKEDFAEHFRSSIQDFYGVFAKEKLPKSGKVDQEFLEATVYQKFKKGQESEIWHALFSKYAQKLTAKPHPKPDYGKGMDDYGVDDELSGLGDLSKGKDDDKVKEGKQQKPKKTSAPKKPSKVEKVEVDDEDSAFGGGGEEETVEL